MPATTVILVRHGQTEWNRIERFRGRFDIPLNETGLEQARRTAERISTWWKPAAVYSSPLQRAMQTAGEIAAATGLQVTKTDELIDIDYGSWQGLSPEEVKEKWPEQHEHWYHEPGKTVIPRAETLV